MAFTVENGAVYITTDVSQIYYDMQYHTSLTYDSTSNTVSATVSDYTGVVQTSWSSAITFENNGVSQSITPTNGVATVSIDPNVAGQITVSTTVSGIRNGTLTFTPNTVKTAQASQIELLRQGYSNTLSGGFQATLSGGTYTFGWELQDQVNLNSTQSAIANNYLSYPVQYADIHGNPLSIANATDLQTLESTATKFMSAQHQQLLSLIGQVQAQTSVPATPVTWSPATY